MSSRADSASDPYESKVSDQLRSEIQRLQKALNDRNLDLAKKNVILEDHAATIRRLEADLEAARIDLEQFEKQFVRLERSMAETETKATAVAAIAEAQLLFEKVVKNDSTSLDIETREAVEDKLRMASTLLDQRNYAAAVYYANRTFRIINQAERTTTALDPSLTRIVAVSAAMLREGPGSNYAKLDRLNYGTVLVQLSQENDWYEVRTRSGKTGWVHGSLLQ